MPRNENLFQTLAVTISVDLLYPFCAFIMPFTFKSSDTSVASAPSLTPVSLQYSSVEVSKA